MTRLLKNLPAQLILVALAAVLASCTNGTTTSTQTLPAGVQLEVHASSGIKFDSATYQATAGDIVVAYINDDAIRHTLIIVQDDKKITGFELQVNKNGDIDSASINLVAGTYTVMCTVPGHQNMKAELTVS